MTKKTSLMLAVILIFTFSCFVFAKNTQTKYSLAPAKITETEVKAAHNPVPVQQAVGTPFRIASRSIIGTSTYPRATCYSGRSIAIGADGTLHAAWCYNSRTDLIRRTYYSHSTDNGETWSPQITVFDTYCGWRCSITAHPTDPNIIAISFSAEPNENDTRRLHVTRSLDGGLTWQPSVNVCGALLNVENSDIQFDPKGGLHVVYECNADNRTYWNYSADNGKTWLPQPEQIDIGSTLLAAFGPALAFDKNTNPHVAWSDGGTAGSFGDKQTYWNWRDMEIGIWMEVPPPRIQASTVGSSCPTFIFDSKGVGHLFADGIEGARHVWYRTYKNGVWSDLTEFAPVGDPAGSTFYGSVAIDNKDNLYVTYCDNTIPGGAGSLVDGTWDIFSGTNASGDWTVINLTADGIDPPQNYPDLATHADATGALHLIFCESEPGVAMESSKNVNIIHMIAYPWPEEPTCLLSSISDTYSKTGPFTVSAVTSDIKGFVASVKLYVQVNGAQVAEMDMEKLATDSWEATFNISGNVGDEVSFYGIATDNEGYTKTSPIQKFSILQPQHPDAPLLLVYQNAYIDSFYTTILDKRGYTYELWDYDAHGGIDASVTTAGWKAILVAGWGVSCVPTRSYEDNAFALFLQGAAAGNQKYLGIISQDYLFSNNEAQGSNTFNAGDFAYDFLQLGEGISDPSQDGATQPPNDSLLIGIADDPISGSFAEEPLELFEKLARVTYNPTATANPNWMDYTIATGQGEDIFFSYNQGYGSGIKYDAGNFRTVYLPWNADMLLDSVLVDTTWQGKISPKAYTLVGNIMKWFDVQSGVSKKVDSAIPKQFALDQNFPNPFNPATSIRIALPSTEQVDIFIYNALGQKIRTLISQKMEAGNHLATWDGRNDSGQIVSSGIYFYSMNAGDFSQTKKMIVIK